MYVVNGTDLRVYDLASRELITTIPLETPATAVAVDDDGHSSTSRRTTARSASSTRPASTTCARTRRSPVDPPTPILTLTGTTGNVVQLAVVDDQLVARTSDGWLAAVDPANAMQTGTLQRRRTP